MPMRVKVLLSYNLYTVPSPVTQKLPLCIPPHWANGEIPVKNSGAKCVDKTEKVQYVYRERKNKYIQVAFS